MVWLKLQFSRLIVADTPTAFDPRGQPGMPFQLLFARAPCGQDSLSADIHHLIALQEHAQHEKFLCLKRRRKRYSKFPTQKYVLHHLKAVQFKINLGSHPFWEAFLPSRAEATCISSLLHQEMCNPYILEKIKFQKKQDQLLYLFKITITVDPCKDCCPVLSSLYCQQTFAGLYLCLLCLYVLNYKAIYFLPFINPDFLSQLYPGISILQLCELFPKASATPIRS